MLLDALLLMLEPNLEEAEQELAERDRKDVARETLRV